MNLTELAEKHRTDKGSRGHGYTDIYEKYMLSFKHYPVRFLEIGICNPKNPGASLEMWKEYFENGEIYGIDIKDCKDLESKRIKTFMCNQKDRKQLNRLVSRLSQFDIIVDDGDHCSDAQLISLVYLIDHLNYDGWYFIEDLHIKEGKETRDYITHDKYPDFLSDNEINILKENVLTKEMLTNKLSVLRRKNVK